MSGSEGSSTKQSTSVCGKGARAELRKKVTHGAKRQQRVHGPLYKNLGILMRMRISLHRAKARDG